MPSWEELYVDREIDDAWRSFRQQVTAALEEPDDVDWLFEVEGVDPDDASQASLIRDDVWFTVSRMTGDVVEFVPGDIDRAVAHLLAVLRDEWKVVHPSFVRWMADPSSDEPRRIALTSRVPAPEQLTGVRSEVWSSLDPRLLVENVDTFLSELFGHGPHKCDDGQVGIEGRRGGLCTIRVHDFDIEVWTAIAAGLEEDASLNGAMDMMPRLLQENPRYRFFLTDGMFVAATVVDGVSFVPDQLRRAIDATLALNVDYDGLSDFLIELAHPQPGCQPDPAEASDVQETLF